MAPATTHTDVAPTLNSSAVPTIGALLDATRRTPLLPTFALLGLLVLLLLTPPLLLDVLLVLRARALIIFTQHQIENPSKSTEKETAKINNNK